MSLTIVGMMLKIVPFLVWYEASGGLAWRAGPFAGELGWPVAEAVAFASLTGGIVVPAGGVALGAPSVIRLAGVLLFAGALAFAAVLASVLRHLLPAP